MNVQQKVQISWLRLCRTLLSSTSVLDHWIWGRLLPSIDSKMGTVASCTCLSMSQTIATLSLPPDTIISVSPLNDKLVTALICPYNQTTQEVSNQVLIMFKMFLWYRVEGEVRLLMLTGRCKLYFGLSIQFTFKVLSPCLFSKSHILMSQSSPALNSRGFLGWKMTLSTTPLHFKQARKQQSIQQHLGLHWRAEDCSMTGSFSSKQSAVSAHRMTLESQLKNQQ